MEYQVTYNGYTVEFFENIDEVNSWIESKLHSNLNPQQIIGEHVTPWTTIRVYKYYTEYCEMFMIEKKH